MQIQLMKQFCGCARYVYNRTLSLERSIYKKDNKHSFKYAEAANRLPDWKKKNRYLEAIQTCTLLLSSLFDEAERGDSFTTRATPEVLSETVWFNDFQPT